jgi:hypothetical protein
MLGIYVQILPENNYFLTRPTYPLPEGVEGKPEIKFDGPYCQYAGASGRGVNVDKEQIYITKCGMRGGYMMSIACVNGHALTCESDECRKWCSKVDIRVSLCKALARAGTIQI